MKTFQPSENSFLNITNDGLFMTKSPNDDRMKYYEHFLTEAKRLVEAHDDAPKQTVIKQICDDFYRKNEL